MCYTIYLLHNPILGAIIGRTASIAPAGSYTVNVCAQALMAIPPMLALSALYFVAIERPCMRRDWPRRLMERVRAGPAREEFGVIKDSMTDRA